MVRRTLACALAVASLVPAAALAAVTTVSYEGVVTRASGTHASEFAAGQAITVDYVVDDAVADYNPDPAAGHFIGGLLELRIQIPAAGVDAVTGAGSVQTFDNAPGPSDQVFFYAAATAGELAGLPVTQAEVDFLEWVGSDEVPSLLASDAIPTAPLLTEDSFAMLYTAEGYTFVYFLADPGEPAPPTLDELVTDGRILLGDLRDDGLLRAGHASALDGKLDEVLASAGAGNVEEACGSLRAFGHQVDALERSGRITGTTASSLRALAAAIGEAVGC